MKKTITCIALSAISFLCFSQTEKLGLIERNSKGTITSVEFRGSEGEKSPRTASDFFTQYLDVKATDHFEKVPYKSKRPGFVHEHYDQHYQGVKVEGAGYNFHFKDGQMYFANGHYVAVEGLNATPSITQEDAINSFLKFKNIEKEKVAGSITELLVKEISKVTSKDTLVSVELVYRVYLQADHEHNDEVGFVDAHTGEVVATEPRLTDLTGTFATRYSGSRQAQTDPVTGGHRLFDNTRGATIHTRNMQNNTTLIANAVELIDNDNNWTAAEHSASKNDMGLDVHWTLQEIYDYLSNTHGINSFDDNNEPINAYIRYGTNTLQRDNAFWDNTINVLYFGQGVSTFKPLAAIDVVAHEFGHGITDFQIGWLYSGDRAAFDEGMSDIWGAIFEQRIRPSSTWRIGEQVMANGKSFLRNLQNTNDNNAHTKIANTFGGSQYNSGDHYVRSGVLSHWFYILVNGKSGTNDVGNSYNVTGIGLDRAEELIMEAVFNNYLDATTTYSSVRTAMINAATAIFCANSTEVKAVTDAWYAVGVGNAYSGVVMATTGAAIICASEVYQISNLPSGTTVTWSSTWNSAPYPTLVHNSPNINELTINNTYGYPSTTTLTATISGSCGPRTLTKQIGSDHSNPVQAGVYSQEACYFHNTYNPGSSGSLPTTYAPLYLRQGCMAIITLYSMGGKSVTYTGSVQPLYWQYNSSEGKLYLQLPYMSGGIPFTFKISGEGACQDKYLLFFSYSQPYYPYLIYPNPANESFNVSITDFEQATELKLYNDQRELVHSTKLTEENTTIPVSNLPQGTYYLNIVNKEGIIQRKILVQH